ncbi:type II toxin-antitoxin system HicA family toxin [Patescibacteria group bacterium]|nr:type II toxin-antitoxin system HicA family toxin [Patescibacteria group bacterium]MBU1931860.1 type II toxin-antitoxin system HicA family toxin [Patescibacteria group bacterium]
MPKLPQVSAKQVIKALAKIGFKQISQKGSHIKLRRKKAKMTETIIVPNHKLIKKGTLRNGILKPAGLSVGEFVKLLKK